MQMLLLNKTINGGLKPAVFSLSVRVEVCGGGKRKAAEEHRVFGYFLGDSKK